MTTRQPQPAGRCTGRPSASSRPSRLASRSARRRLSGMDGQLALVADLRLAEWFCILPGRDSLSSPAISGVPAPATRQPTTRSGSTPSTVRLEMLSAPGQSTSALPPTRPEQLIRVAGTADVWRVAVGHSRAVAARSRRPARRLLLLAPVVTALRLIGPVGRGEVWMCGVGTSVVLTVDPPRRTPARIALLSVAAHVAVLVAAPVVLTVVTAGIAGPAAAVGPIVAIGWLAAVLLPLLATVRRSRHADAVPLIRAGRSGRTVRLHDLARHPGDPAGTGTGLLAVMLMGPAYRDDTVVTVAASRRLAELYAASGMTVQRTRSTRGGVA